MRTIQTTRAVLAACMALAAMSGAPASADPDAGPVDPGNPHPPADPGLSDTETSFIGAVMLKGEDEVTMGSVGPGLVGDPALWRYAYFAGNTLYAGVKDANGNSVDIIAEFFWFESSTPRGSDFYVGVVKARTSPSLATGWSLVSDDPGSLTDWLTPDSGPTVYVSADTDVSTGAGSFRWDWSIPFDSYGWESFGNVTMKTSYGLGVNGEGSVQQGERVTKDGITLEEEVQAKGFLSSDYKVSTKYEVTLWRWQLLVNSNAGSLNWALMLNNGDRERQNAYHEFFIVMQAQDGMPFHIDRLEVGGHIKRKIPFWPDQNRALSASVSDIVLRQPAVSPAPVLDDPIPADAGAFDFTDPAADDGAVSGGGCSEAGSAGKFGGLVALIALWLLAVAVARRRVR